MNFNNVSKQVKKMLVKGILFFSASATAAIPPMVYPKVEERSASMELNLDEIARLDLMFQNETKDFDIASYIPTKDLNENMSGSQFAHLVIKNSLNRFIESKSDSATWRAVDKAAQGFSTNDIKIGGKNGTNHSIKFRVNPVEAQTKIVYRGVASAEVSYDVDDNVLKFEVSNSIGFATVVAAHTNTGSDRSDTVGVRWEF